jgi:anti-anti-sigma factor
MISVPITDLNLNFEEGNDFDLKLSCHVTNGFLVIDAEGLLEETTVSIFNEFIRDSLLQVTPIVVLDMSRIRYVDSEGFGALIHFQMKLMESSCKLALLACQKSVQEALKLTRLYMLLPAYTSLGNIPGHP